MLDNKKDILYNVLCNQLETHLTNVAGHAEQWHTFQRDTFKNVIDVPQKSNFLGKNVDKDTFKTWRGAIE